MQTACEDELRSSTKVPVDAQLETHEPLEKKGVAPPLHERHCELDGPLHVVHEASQSTQTPLLLARLPRGVHDETHEPA